MSIEKNTTDLQLILNVIKNLPNASDIQGGSGGGSAETCTIEVAFDGPMIAGFTCHYVNASGEYKTKSSTGTISDIQKNTLMVVYDCSSMYLSSDTATRVGHAFSTSAFYITGDGYITFQG